MARSRPSIEQRLDVSRMAEAPTCSSKVECELYDISDETLDDWQITVDIGKAEACEEFYT